MKVLKPILFALIFVLLAEVGFLVYNTYGDVLFHVGATEAATQSTATVATEAPTTETENTLQLPPAVTATPTEAVTEAPTEVQTVATTEVVTEVPTEVATEEPTEAETEAALEAVTEAATEAATEATTEAVTEAATEEPTEAPTEAPEETKASGTETFLLTFAGNCVFGGAPSDNSDASFASVVGDDYGHPFRNVESVFANDEFTFLDLECVLSDSGEATDTGYVFRGPSAYAKILSTGNVEAVSLANDHTDDFGPEGYDATKASLEAEGIAYVEKNDYLIHTTEHGLKIGIYAVSVKFDRWNMQQAINKMNKEGADLIVVWFHWGELVSYAPNVVQIKAAHSAIDNGADIVLGTNGHLLQGVEYYKHGMICYSLGNFSYGGNKWPTDFDTVIVQQEVVRDSNGKISLGEGIFLPCRKSSAETGNNFQPVLLEVDTWQYNSVLKKLTEPIWETKK